MRAHKKFDGLTGLLYLSFVFRFRVDKDDDSDSTLLQNDGKTLSACRMVFLCVCMCVCLYSFIVNASSVCNNVLDTLEGYQSTILCCEYYTRCFCQAPLSLFPNVIFPIQR